MRRLYVPRVTVDFSDIQEFEPLEKGEYSCTITNATYVEPQVEDKYPYINLELTVDEPGFENRKVWLIWSLSPKALFRMKADLESLGIVDEDEEIEIEYDDDAEPPVVTQPELIGLPAVVVMDKPRTYENRLQNNPAMLRAQDGAAPKANGKAKAKAGGKKKFK